MPRRRRGIRIGAVAIAANMDAMSVGGIGVVHRLVTKLRLPKEIGERRELLKVHLPYHESDHVLNFACNVMRLRETSAGASRRRRIHHCSSWMIRKHSCSAVDSVGRKLSRSAWRRYLLVGIVLTVAAGCDESFSPIEPSALELSVFGYLNASADTQWIRLAAIRPVILTSSGPLGATVTLEEAGTGRVIELRDSVFHFPPPNTTAGPEGIYRHNYWTTEKIQPGATYGLSAVMDGQPPSEATIKVPADYGIELWTWASGASSARLRLVGLRYVGFVVIITRYSNTCGGIFIRRVHYETGSPASDTQMIDIRKPQAPLEACPPLRVESQQILIVGSGTEWPTGGEYGTGGLAVPTLPSNVSNAIGYVGGVLTHVIPYDQCIFAGARRTDICRLRYDSASVTLRGTVTGFDCGDPIPNATIELRELDPELPTRIRPASSNSSGAYVIGALEPNEPYALSIAHQEDATGVEFQTHTDTVEFQPGEQATYDVALRGPVCDI